MAEHKHCYLFDLPTELRLYIYDIVFASLANKAAPKEMTHATAILQTNSSIFKEASGCFEKYSQSLAEQLDTKKDKAGDATCAAEKSSEGKKLAWREYLRLLGELGEVREMAIRARQFKDGDKCWWLTEREKKYAGTVWWKWRLFARLFDLMGPFAKVEFEIEFARLRRQYHEDGGS